MTVSMTAASAATLLTRPASCPGPLLRNGVVSYGNRSPKARRSTEWSKLYARGGAARGKPAQSTFAKFIRTPSILGIFIIVYFIGCLSPAAFGPSSLSRRSKRQEEKMHRGITGVPCTIERRELGPGAGEGRILPSRRLGRPDGLDAKGVHRLRSTTKVDVFYRQEGFTVPLHDALDTMLWVDDSVALYSSDPLPSNPSVGWRLEAERLRKWITDPESPSTAPVMPSHANQREGNSRTIQGSRKFRGVSSDTIDDKSLASLESLALKCPNGPIRVFIGITSRCCTPSAIEKRHALRTSWVKTIRSEYKNSIKPIFILSQPNSDMELSEEMLEYLTKEAASFGDIAVVPGRERYSELPTKTLGLIGFALSSPCNYTHILKTDDDVYLRPHKLMQLIQDGERKYEFEIQNKQPLNLEDLEALTFDGQPPRNDSIAKAKSRPWMRGVYVGKIDSNQTGVFPGWYPNRTVTSKWYLSEKILRDEESPLGVRWASGWGYLMSRDVALKAWQSTIKYALGLTDTTQGSNLKRPQYWGKLPWEDVLIAALLSDNSFGDSSESGPKGSIRLSHHPGFKAAWDGCDEDTVLKHLDNDAPGLVAGLAAQDASKLWEKKEVICSTGPFTPNDYEGWRQWRNTLPDNIRNGFM